MTTGQQCLQVYQRALEIVNSDMPDLEAEVIVHLWQMCVRQKEELAQKDHKISLLEMQTSDDVQISPVVTDLFNKLTSKG